MSKQRKKQAEKEAEKEAIPRITERRASRTGILVIGLIIAVVLIVVGAIYYRSQVAPFQQPVVSVDGETINMGYFLKRVKMSIDDPTTVLYQLVDEEIIRQTAETLDLTIEPLDIDNYLLYRASTEDLTGVAVTENTTVQLLTEDEFKAWYKGELEHSGLSNAEYREMVRIELISVRLHEILAEMVSTATDQVHLNVILAEDRETAEAAQARIEAGESFADVAREVSMDARTRESGGDTGWYPRGVLPYDSVIFGLEIGEVSQPVAVSSSGQYLLFMVSEKAVNRELDQRNLDILKSDALSNWLAQEETLHNIQVIYDFNDQENQAWVAWQLSR